MRTTKIKKSKRPVFLLVALVIMIVSGTWIYYIRGLSRASPVQNYT